MKRTNSVSEALNADAAEIDLGDGLSATLPLGNVTQAATDAALGPKIISYDPATGRPYWDATTGTHRIFTRYDGRPYAALTPDITTTTPSGRPALDN